MIRKLIIFIILAIFIVMPASAWEFKEQDIKKATDECKDDSPCKPELVPTTDKDGNVNLALLKVATPNADSLLGGWCPARHCTEYLNDGFYNNCRSWITSKPSGQEAWAEIDMGAVYQIKKVGFGSDHCGNYKDRSAKDFKILVATKYNKDSNDNSWKVVYDNKDGEMVNQTKYFDFNPVEARYVRISITKSNQSEVRIDEIEIYGGFLDVNPKSKLASYWGQIKILNNE